MRRATGFSIAAVVPLAGPFLLGCTQQRSVRTSGATFASAQGADPKGQEPKRKPGELEENEEEAGEETVPFASLPAPVRAAAERLLQGAVDLTAEKETEGGVTHYEVGGWKDGKGITVTLSGDGELVELETETSFPQLPRAVQERLKKEHPTVSFGVVELVEPRYFELKFKSDGKVQEVQIYPSGMLKKD
ncbi:MAG TPA: hypothetical protein VFI25_10665 [Planctomycetota bacterium]|jgi:hypothetical protein|nr:hypothetical protein [Planctomycetota bacterium]